MLPVVLFVSVVLIVFVLMVVMVSMVVRVFGRPYHCLGIYAGITGTIHVYRQRGRELEREREREGQRINILLGLCVALLFTTFRWFYESNLCDLYGTHINVYTNRT